MSPAVVELMGKAANSVAKVGLLPRGRLDERVSTLNSRGQVFHGEKLTSGNNSVKQVERGQMPGKGTKASH